MMKYKEILYAFALSSFILSCSSKQKSESVDVINYTDFKDVQQLKGKNIEFDETILKPVRLEVFDSLLLTINSKQEKHLHIYNLQSHKKLGERISLGQGPYEMIIPRIVKASPIGLYLCDLATSTMFKYDIKEFLSNPNPIPAEQVKMKERVFGEVGILQNHFVGPAHTNNYLLHVFNANGEKVDTLGHYPTDGRSLSPNEIMETYMFSFITNGKDKIAVCYNWADFIDIYNAKGVLLKRIQGPKHFVSQFKEFHDGDVVSASPVKGKTRDAYFNPVNVNDEFFVLFSGKSEAEDNYNILANQILVYDWNGNPKRIFHIDQGIFAMAVDSKHKKIYGISNEPEFHVVEFSYE